MDEEVNRDNAPRAEHPDSSSPPSLVLDGNITDVVKPTTSVSVNKDLAMTDAEDAQIAQHMSTISPAALDVAGNNLDKKSEQAPFEKLPNELRHIIIGYIGINKSLYNAVRVNKAWFDSLIDHIWYKPGWMARRALVRPAEGRRQFYADKIRIFELDGSGPTEIQNRQSVYWIQVRLPNLQKLVYDGPSNPPDEILCSLLEPTLVSVEFRSSFDVSPSVLEALQNCPRLRHLVFQDSVVVFDLDPFIDFITNHSCMTSIKFGGGTYTTDPLVDHSNKIYAHLLRLSRFSSLSLGKEIDQTDAEEIMNMVGRPLVPNNSLTSLSIHGDTLAVNLFLSTATRALRSLNITLLEEYSGNVCDQLSQFTNLAELRLRMCSSQTLPQSEFDALTHLSKLEVLGIFSRYSGDVSASTDWLTNEHFNQWVMNFPHLHDLTLVWDNEHLTESAMLAVASHCRKLERCTLGWKQDLDAWKSCTSGTVLFPHLNHLGLRDLEDLPNMNEEHWVAQALPYLELLFELAPRLERLELLTEDDDYCKTTRAIQTAIKEIGGKHCYEDSSFYWKFSKEVVEKYKDEKDKDEKDKDEKHRDENHKDDEHS
ncbi:hypothetical protein D6D23_08109 [Aureobasidium pullulans]|uniref:F-box domain-containing protein n=1 Tax=Aureobasidium pullulans TaxID=5580 RepID=A0A4S8VYX9_AURPU|nr:hypothetical protein D6D23_08109 [Aureobasidium pullulans]THW56586.1 hypothetical protein D6D20_08617 [Aureobasidium pullulans]THZ95323.1 hypothetical protein D6C82_07759 [Aureobasidium pullulans]